jgi:hypothetical protein
MESTSMKDQLARIEAQRSLVYAIDMAIEQLEDATDDRDYSDHPMTIDQTASALFFVRKALKQVQ